MSSLCHLCVVRGSVPAVGGSTLFRKGRMSGEGRGHRVAAVSPLCSPWRGRLQPGPGWLLNSRLKEGGGKAKRRAL